MSAAPLCDAHCHLQDARFEGRIDEIVAVCRGEGITRMVVNGTREADWDAVAALADRYPDLVIPSYGLHPWWIGERSSAWETNLLARLEAHPEACLGEVGLDRWIEGHDLELQEPVFLRQLEMATEGNLPLSIHCLRCWGRILELLQTNPRPARGFLLHSYGGSVEMIPAFAALGARFSFSGYFLNPRKGKARAAFQAVPPDRFLLETDAPDQRLPADLDAYTLTDTEGAPLNHPANLARIANALPEFGVTPDQVSENFRRFFLEDR